MRTGDVKLEDLNTRWWFSVVVKNLGFAARLLQL